MPETILGLPAHVLIIHAVVVIGPLAALTAIAYAAIPRVRANVKWWLAGFATVTGITSWVAADAGEKLQAKLVGLGATPDTEIGQRITEHAEAGDLLRWVGPAFMVLVLVSVFYLVPVKGGGTPNALRVVTSVVLVLASLFLIYQVGITGHTGAEAVWSS